MLNVPFKERISVFFKITTIILLAISLSLGIKLHNIVKTIDTMDIPLGAYISNVKSCLEVTCAEIERGDDPDNGLYCSIRYCNYIVGILRTVELWDINRDELPALLSLTDNELILVITFFDSLQSHLTNLIDTSAKYVEFVPEFNGICTLINSCETSNSLDPIINLTSQRSAELNISFFDSFLCSDKCVS